MHINLLVRAFLYASIEHIFNYFTQNMHIKPRLYSFLFAHPSFFSGFSLRFPRKTQFFTQNEALDPSTPPRSAQDDTALVYSRIAAFPSYRLLSTNYLFP